MSNDPTTVYHRLEPSSFQRAALDAFRQVPPFPRTITVLDAPMYWGKTTLVHMYIASALQTHESVLIVCASVRDAAQSMRRFIRDCKVEKHDIVFNNKERLVLRSNRTLHFVPWSTHTLRGVAASLIIIDGYPPLDETAVVAAYVRNVVAPLYVGGAQFIWLGTSDQRNALDRSRVYKPRVRPLDVLSSIGFRSDTPTSLQQIDDARTHRASMYTVRLVVDE